MLDDEREFDSERQGAPLVLMVKPEPVVHACGDCRHHHGEPPYTMYCRALGGRSCVGLRTKWTCPMFEPSPPGPPRVGLLRTLWRLLW